MLSWSACIATLNRHDVLMVALTHVLRQTRAPDQIIIIDTSDNWQEGKARAEEILAAHESAAAIELCYQTSPVRSSATQRNLAISLSRTDIVFMIDDDSFLHDNCAAALMEVYEADTAEAVAGIGALLVDENPAAQPGSAGAALDRKQTGRVILDRIARQVLNTRLGRWINREILFQSAEMLFLRYDEPRKHQIPPALAHLDVDATPFMPGSGMSLRRKISDVEQFDTALRYYAAFEDLDMAYRIARHGAVLRANGARLHHFEAAAGRIKRQKAITFQLLNMAIFLKRHAAEPEAFRSAYQRMLYRRLLSEFLKDMLSRRWRFPQVAGVLTAMRHWTEVWSHKTADIDTWYPDLQKRILEDIR